MLQSLGLLILRVGVGGMMLAGHGWHKVVNFTLRAGQFPDPLGIGSTASMSLVTFAEALCALLVILGIATRLAAVPLVVNMLVAAFIVHGGDPWGKKEFALLYAIPFLSLIFTGGGAYALDRVLWGRKGSRQSGLRRP